MKESESRGARTPRGPVSSDDTTGQPQQQSALRRQKKEKEATALDAALASCAYVDSVIHRGGKVRYYWTRPVVRILLYGVNVFWCCVCRGKPLYSSILMSEGVPVLSPSPLDSLKWIHDWLNSLNIRNSYMDFCRSVEHNASSLWTQGY